MFLKDDIKYHVFIKQVSETDEHLIVSIENLDILTQLLLNIKRNTLGDEL